MKLEQLKTVWGEGEGEGEGEGGGVGGGGEGKSLPILAGLSKV